MSGDGSAGGVTPVPSRGGVEVLQGLFAPEPDRREGRVLGYAGLALVLWVTAVLVNRISFTSSATLHTLLETVSTSLALVVGSLSLVRFYSRRQNTFLFVGVGFLGAGLLEAYHALITSALLTDPADPTLPDLTAWTWIGSRVFLSLFLFTSWLVWYQEERGGARPLARGRVEEQSVFITAAVLTVVMFVFFAYVPLASAFHPELWLSRPAELIPAFIFGFALCGHLWKGEWARDSFEHWLILALILSVGTHAGFLVFSSELYDLPAVAAHLAKIASYVAFLIGLLASVYVTFRREGDASAVILESNAALAHEIRTRREAEEVLLESEGRLRDFLDSASDLIQSVDPTGRIIYANQAWKRTLGYSDEELGELYVDSVIHPESAAEYRRIVERVFAGKVETGFELILRTRDGRPVYCSGSSNCRFEDGVPVATRSVLRNETEERRAAEELTRYQANVRALLESTGDAIWSVDPGYRLIIFNAAFELTVEAITGRVPVIGDPMERTHAPSAALWYEECYRRAMLGTRFSAVRQETVGGHPRLYELFFNPIEGEEGPVGWWSSRRTSPAVDEWRRPGGGRRKMRRRPVARKASSLRT
jgi:PAS domain S-box-containing protein